MIIENINKTESSEWYSLTTQTWLKWTKRYNASHVPYTPAERNANPGQRGYKNIRLSITRLMKKNIVTHPTTISDYINAIKLIWELQDTLSKTPKGQKMQEFCMRTASTWPLDFFKLDWDATGNLHATEDTKAWWAIQKMTGFHCHRRKLHDASKNPPAPNTEAFDGMDLEDNYVPPSKTGKKRKSQNDDHMEINPVPETPLPGKNANAPIVPPTIATPSPAGPDAWNKVGPNGKAAKPATPKRFLLPLAQRVKALCTVKIPGSHTEYNTYFDVTLYLPKHDKPQKNSWQFLKICIKT